MATTARTLLAKFDGDTKGLARAARDADKVIDDFDRNAKKKFSDSGKDSSKGFGASFKKWFSTSALKDMHDSGKFGASAFGSGLLGALKTPVLGPILVGAFTAAAAVTLPAVGAVAGGAIVTGVGAGLAGLGLVFAAKSDEVKRVWSGTLEQLGADMELLAEPFEDTLIGIAGIFQRTVDAFNPYLDKAFEDMAGPIEAFVDDAGAALEELIPAIDPVTDAFNEVLGSLGPALQSAIGDVADGMIALADSVAANPDALADMVEGIGSLINTGLNLLTTLNDINTEFSELTGGTSLVDLTLGGLESTVKLVEASFSGLSAGLGAVNALLGRNKTDADSAGASMNAAADMVTKAAQSADANALASGRMRVEHGKLAPAVQTAADKIRAQDQALQNLLIPMGRVSSLALQLSGAQISFEAAVDDATASIKDNGKTLDIHTEKGRANRTALDNLATAANNQTAAIIKSGKGMDAAKTSAEKSRREFSTMAQKMGLSKEKADALATSLIAIPNVTRSVTIQWKQTGRGNVNLTAPGSEGRRAAGGPVLPGRSYLVGEKGPELLTMGSSPGHITPNHELGGGETTVQVFIGDEPLDAKIVRVVKEKNRQLRRAATAGAPRMVTT